MFVFVLEKSWRRGSFYLIFILFHVQIENGWFLYSEDDFYISFGLVVYSFQLEIPKQLFGPNVFNVWMILFLNILGSSVPLEGQPAVPSLGNHGDGGRSRNGPLIDIHLH